MGGVADEAFDLLEDTKPEADAPPGIESVSPPAVWRIPLPCSEEGDVIIVYEQLPLLLWYWYSLWCAQCLMMTVV
jgi:hypothetical protein